MDVILWKCKLFKIRLPYYINSLVICSVKYFLHNIFPSHKMEQVLKYHLHLQASFLKRRKQGWTLSTEAARINTIFQQTYNVLSELLYRNEIIGKLNCCVWMWMKGSWNVCEQLYRVWVGWDSMVNAYSPRLELILLKSIEIWQPRFHLRWFQAFNKLMMLNINQYFESLVPTIEELNLFNCGFYRSSFNSIYISILLRVRFIAQIRKLYKWTEGKRIIIL